MRYPFFIRKKARTWAQSVTKVDFALLLSRKCGRSAVGSAEPCQGSGRGFDPRRPLSSYLESPLEL